MKDERLERKLLENSDLQRFGDHHAPNMQFTYMTLISEWRSLKYLGVSPLVPGVRGCRPLIALIGAVT